jgi:hypothetical protein
VSAAGAVARPTAREWVAGYLAAIAIAVSLIGIAWHPVRLVLPSIALALVASAMGGRHRRLAFAAVLVGALSFFLGMMFAVITSNTLW